MTEQNKVVPKCFEKPISELSEHELRCELAYWHKRIDEAPLPGASFDQAIGYRDECEQRLARFEQKPARAEDFAFGQLVMVDDRWHGVVIGVRFDAVRVAQEDGEIGWWNRDRLTAVTAHE